jgi:hypothetical protein
VAAVLKELTQTKLATVCVHICEQWNSHTHLHAPDVHTHTPLAAEEFPGDKVDTIGRRRRLDLRLAVLARVSSDRGDCVPGVPVCVCMYVRVCTFEHARVYVCVCLFVCVYVCTVEVVMQERRLSQEEKKRE